MEGQSLRVSMPAFRVIECFTKLLRRVVGFLREKGVRCVIYLDDILLMEQSREVLRQHTALAISLLESLGFLINYPKSHLEPSQLLEYLGFLVDMVKKELNLPKEKIERIKKEATSGSSVSKNPGQSSGSDDSGSYGSVSSSTPLQGFTEAEAQGTSCCRLRWDNKGFSRGQTGSQLVGRQPVRLEWKGSGTAEPSDIYRDRCIPFGMGRFLPGRKFWRLLEPMREIAPYQLAGASGSVLCIEGICEANGCQFNCDSVGQHNGGGTSEQDGRYQIPISSSTDEGNLDMVSGTSSENQSPVSTGETEYHGRLPIETSTGQDRLGTESGVFFGNRQVVGSHGGGPFRHSLFNSAATFLQLEGRPRGSGNGCFFTSLEREGCVCTPSLVPHRQDPPEGETGRCNTGSDNPALESTALVSSYLGDVDRSAITSSGQRHTSSISQLRLTTNNQLQLVAWRVSADSSKQEKFRAKQLSLSCARGERKQTLIITLPGRSGRSGAGTEVSVPFLQISNLC